MITEAIQESEFIREFTRELHNKNAAVFAGAGLSMASGYVDWKTLLRDIICDLRLNPDQEDDLVTLAQYHCNQSAGNKARLTQTIFDHFRSTRKPTENHRILARLPIYTYWTTNYDKLIEQSLEDEKKVPDVKYTLKQLAVTRQDRDVAVYKMHGDVDHAAEAVISKDDYEAYGTKMEPFVSALRGDLIEKTFLFLGFSFTDPNIDYILSRVRVQYEANQRRHYSIQKRVSRGSNEPIAAFKYRLLKQNYFIRDLKRFGIFTVLVDDYSDITALLQVVATSYKRSSILISGAAVEYGTWKQCDAEGFLHNLSHQIVSNKNRLISGVGIGVGSAVINGALAALEDQGRTISDESVVMRPFPQIATGGKSLKVRRTEYRNSMIDHAGIAIFVFGNMMTQIREEAYFTNGRVIVRGKTVKRGEAKKADYILSYKPNLPLAVVEAKDNTHTVAAGMQQALEYAEILDVPFAYSSNGDAFLEHDRTVFSGPVTREIPLDQFPSAEELWNRYRQAKGFTASQEAVATQNYYDDGSRKIPRYYQHIAINRTVESIARGENRILLVMATGTGKTYTAFQIIWRLWKSGAKKRILFLVDRNILADQTKTNDFKPFGQAMTKITNRTVDKAFEIYLCLYQAVTGTEEEQNIYTQFSPDFFDLIVIDECHRGSAADDAAWRKVLEYFTSATQIGLTATPKETKEISNIEYFGDPIYTYSLRQGISDGFLAPYKVVRIGIDKDLDGWRPEAGQTDKHGQLIEDREYNSGDYDRNLILEKRTELVAAKVTEFLKATDRFAKTIIFCENIDHAERMRQALVNANPDLAAANAKYIMRITGDNDEGKAQLDNFIDPESTYPVIACTSRLMSTGVDAQTCHLIVLDRIINSPTEFKQIIGRGTRINEDYGKLYFTIMDFKRATAQFADPDFDGDPVQIYEPKDGETVVPPDEGEAATIGAEDPSEYDASVDPDFDPTSAGQRPTKYYVNNVEVRVATERVQYLDVNGRLITESLKDYSRKTVRQAYASLNDFLTVWNDAEKKLAILEELAAKGVFLDELAEQVGRDYDAFDLVCHVAFDAPPLTRKERAEKVRKRNVFAKYGERSRAVLDALLQKYADSGLKSVESLEILKVDPLTAFGTPIEIVALFGGKPAYLAAVRELESSLYPQSA